MMKKVLVLIVLFSSLVLSENLDDRKFGLYKMDYDKKTKCLVRHLEVYKNPRWVAKITLKNHKKIFFSSPKSMFEFYHQPGKWFDVGVKSEKDFKHIVVTDFTNMKLINAKRAYYVYGGNITSPAGDDLPAFKSKEDAQIFSDMHNGKRIMDFNTVSPALIRLLNGSI